MKTDTIQKHNADENTWTLRVTNNLMKDIQPVDS